jgi:hypothetical protein
MFTINEVHVALGMKGTQESMLLFHQLAKGVDGDWPYLQKGATVPACSECGGLPYKRPLLSPHSLKRLAKQAGLRKLKIKHYAPNTTCYGPKGHV